MKGFFAVAGLIVVTIALGQLTVAKVTGNWEGESKCVDLKAAPNCHDEHVIYRITPIKGQSSKVQVQADKVVNGKPDNMGTFDFDLDAKQGTLRSEFTFNSNHGVWFFTVKGDQMTGTLTKLPSKTVIRRISVKRGK